MDSLCDDILLCLTSHLDDPSAAALSQVNKRLGSFLSQDYVRACWFRDRYENPLFHALGHTITTAKVIDILLTSGAPLSRYLVQCAAQHYFGVKTLYGSKPHSWTRRLPFPVFSHFLSKAAEEYGASINFTKGSDDGSLFSQYLTESRWDVGTRTITWEEIGELLTKFKFIPFSPKDPLIAQYPLVLAVEPRLLPMAQSLGFTLDSKYRDFIFRKMFQHTTVQADTRAEDIVRNVQALERLDPSMYLKRTVAGEVCMEAGVNVAGYSALKMMQKTGKQLMFDLPTLVHDLIKLFAHSRSISTTSTIDAIRLLHKDFPSNDPTIRLVLMLSVFASDANMSSTGAALHEKLQSLNLTPISEDEIRMLVAHPLIEQSTKVIRVMNYAKSVLKMKRRELLEYAAVDTCLEVASKGRFYTAIKDLFPGLYPAIHTKIAARIVKHYQIELYDLPSADDEAACLAYKAPLGVDFLSASLSSPESEVVIPPNTGPEVGPEEDGIEVDRDDSEDKQTPSPELGDISQQTLSRMISIDQQPERRRTRYGRYWQRIALDEKIEFPTGATSVLSWAKTEFGHRSNCVAVFMTHALLNDNSALLHNGDNSEVPITFKHFQLLARLGRAPPWSIWWLLRDKRTQCPKFYADEHEYCTAPLPPKSSKAQDVVAATQLMPLTVKSEPTDVVITKKEKKLPPRGKKRPRRSAVVPTYVVPDSDDEDIAEEGVSEYLLPVKVKVEKKVKVVSERTKWIRHLDELLAGEEAKYKGKKKRLEKEAGQKLRVSKTAFHKALVPSLREIRRVDLEERNPDDDQSEDEVEEKSEGDSSDDDYVERPTKKAKRTTH